MQNKRIIFHGTNKEKAEKILKEGFKPDTYFALHLEDSLEFGGEYVFYVAVECGEKNWQPRFAKRISTNRIIQLIKVSPKIIYENNEVSKKHFPSELYPCSNCGEDIGRVKLSIFGKPTKPKCPKCKKLFSEL